MTNKNSQTFWVSISFILVGLIVGLLLTGNNFLGTGGTSVVNSDAQQVFNVKSLAVVNASPDDDAVLGNPEAPVTMIEFSDYQCPYCYSFWSKTFPQIKTQYIDTGKVKFVYRDFPIPTHGQAEAAAESAECVRSLSAADKDLNYYKMNTLIFAGVTDWSQNTAAKDVFVSYGKQLGVDITACLDNGTMKQEVGDDYASARSYGVGGTPTFFINGKMVLGAETFEHFQEVIESVL